MNAALEMVELSPEALSLIRQGTPQPKIEKPVIVQEVKEPKESKEPKEPNQPKNEPVPNAGVTFLSFRLPSQIAHALLKASLDRKLNRMRPWTQQEITAEALSAWLRKHDYLE